MRKTDDWTVVHQVRAQASALGERPFISFERGESLSYAALDERSDRIAAALAGLGIQPGDRVLALLRNGPPFLLAMLGTMKCGAVFVPVNTELRGAFLEHQLRNAEPRLVLVDDERLDAFRDVDAGDAAPAHVVVCAEAGPGPLPGALASAAARSFTALEELGAAHCVPAVTPAPHDIAGIMYTSGTTGPSKGVLMPYAHCHVLSLTAAEAMRLTDEDVYYVCMPLFHVNGLFMQVMAAHLVGARVHLAERFSTGRWLDEVIATGATVTNALGVMPEFIFNTAASEDDRAHRLRAIMAVPIGKAWGQAFEARFGVKLLQGFGMTECGMTIYGSLDDDEPLIPGCAGYPLDEFFEIRIADPETDDPLPANEVGEMLVRPRVPAVFSAGYHRMPDKTVEAWRNLWFHTGDAARMDERGRVHYVDRIKDRIRRRGENISAFEVEQVLNGHPQVAESAVVGVKAEGAGGEDEVMAFLVPEPGERIDPTAVLDYCVTRMPRYALPRFIETAASLDKTASGKLRKQDLRDRGAGEATWDREAAGYVVPRS